MIYDLLLRIVTSVRGGHLYGPPCRSGGLGHLLSDHVADAVLGVLQRGDVLDLYSGSVSSSYKGSVMSMHKVVDLYVPFPLMQHGLLELALSPVIEHEILEDFIELFA
jgi:hypothetical protein